MIPRQLIWNLKRKWIEEIDDIRDKEDPERYRRVDPIALTFLISNLTDFSL